MKSIFFKIKSFSLFSLIGITILSGLFFVTNAFAFETYEPGETIIIGEFIYNDDYTPTTDDCTVSVYSPAGVALVSEVTMTDDATGWHRYAYTTPLVEGKYPTFITCGSLVGGDLLKLDKTFVLKNPVVTDSSIAAAVDANTSADIASAVTTINTNTDTNTSSIATTLSAIPGTIWAYSGRTLTSFGTLVADIVSDVWSAPSRSLTTFGTLAADIWDSGTRTLTSGALTVGSLATASDLSSLATSANITAAVAPLATSAELTAATAPLATDAMLTLVKTKTDTIDWTDVTTIKNNVATLITEVGVGNISGIKTATDTIDWADVTGLVTDTGAIKAKTDTIAWADVSAIKTSTDTIAWADVTGIKAKTDTILWTDIADLAKTTDVTAAVTAINANTNSAVSTAVSTLSTLVDAVPLEVWTYSARDLTSLGTLVSDIWSAATRTLTSVTISPQSPWTVATSNFGTITAGSAYLATVTTVYDGTLTDSLSAPVVTIYDPSRNIVVNAVAMTRTAVGTYTYSYTTAANAEAGTWESVFSTTVESGKTLPGNDYWTVQTTPAQVLINSVTDTTTPEVAANITITNEGLTGNEYQYEWCVVSSVNNVCGGGDDVFHAIAAKYINAGEDFNTTLTATVPTAGTYYFKVVAYFGTDSSVASRLFTATTESTGGGSGGGGGGGGGSGGSSSENPKGVCTKKADFNCDGKVNSIDFSILLYFWKSKPPFKNQYVDLNKDLKVDSVDFSILLFEWGK